MCHEKIYIRETGTIKKGETANVNKSDSSRLSDNSNVSVRREEKTIDKDKKTSRTSPFLIGFGFIALLAVAFVVANKKGWV